MKTCIIWYSISSKEIIFVANIQDANLSLMIKMPYQRMNYSLSVSPWFCTGHYSPHIQSSPIYLYWKIFLGHIIIPYYLAYKLVTSYSILDFLKFPVSKKRRFLAFKTRIIKQQLVKFRSLRLDQVWRNGRTSAREIQGFFPSQMRKTSRIDDTK